LPCDCDCKWWPEEWYKCQTEGGLCRDSPGKLIDEIDVGVLASEASHDMTGWGPIEPQTHGGNWGGGDDGTIRTVWYFKDLQGCDKYNPKPASCLKNYDQPWASFSLENNGKICARTLVIRALDGIADDSFTVTCNNKLVYTYTDTAPVNDPETWNNRTINIQNLGLGMCTAKLNCKITATGPAWDLFNTYGQLGISHIWLKG
jgi:hypothetical protein